MKIKEYELLENHRLGGIRCYHSLQSPQQRSYNAHHHTQCELSVFLAGSGTYTVRGKNYTFSAGDVFLFGSNEEHCITNITSDIDLFNVQFEPYLLWEKADTMGLLSLFNARTPDFENKFHDPDGTLQKMLLEIEKELSQKRPCYAVAVRYLLFMALLSLIRNHAGVDHTKTGKASDSTAQSLRLSIDYIQQNLESKLTLKEISAVACLCPTYFSYVFKKFNGISLWEYITIKRVERAIEMLKQENLTKLEIAERCGFSSPSHFYKSFAAVTGRRPGDFTKNE